MSKQQTAVEWLSEQFDSIVELYPSQFERVNRAIEQAKEMEKEQNKNYLKSYFEWHKSMGFVSHKPEDIIEFNENYGGNK
jgi:hypothetical protein